jgi:hypothetical protein
MMTKRLALWLLIGVWPLAADAAPGRRRPARRPPPSSVPILSPDDAPAPPTSSDEARATTEAAPADAAAKTPAPPAGESAPPAPPPSAPAANAPATSAASPDLQKLRADYDRLRDDLFRTRSRAQLVQEGLYGARLGATFEWKAAPDYVIRHAEVRLDGGTIWDSGEKPVTDDLLRIAERPCKPGPHALTLRLEIRPGTKKKGRDIEQLGYASEHTFAIVVPDAQKTTVVITGDEDGALPEYEPELEVELESEAIKK